MHSVEARQMYIKALAWRERATFQQREDELGHKPEKEVQNVEYGRSITAPYAWTAGLH